MNDFLSDAREVLGEIKATQAIINERLSKYDAIMKSQDEKIEAESGRYTSFRNVVFTIIVMTLGGLVSIGFKADSLMEEKLEKKGYASEKEVFFGFKELLDMQENIGKEAGVLPSFIDRERDRAESDIEATFGIRYRGQKKQ